MQTLISSSYVPQQSPVEFTYYKATVEAIEPIEQTYYTINLLYIILSTYYLSYYQPIGALVVQ